VKERRIEIVVLVEGCEELTSSSVQARHSYKGSEIVWHHTYAPCVFERDEGGCCVDFRCVAVAAVVAAVVVVIVTVVVDDDVSGVCNLTIVLIRTSLE